MFFFFFFPFLSLFSLLSIFSLIFLPFAIEIADMKGKNSFVALARGECGYFGEDNIPNAVEGCKSNALTRCCKDLGIASELWDPRFIRRYIKEYTRQIEVYYGYGTNAKKKVITIRKDDEVMPPYRPIKPTTAIPSSIPANMATTATKTGITNPTSAKPIATTTTPKPVNNLNATVVKAAGYKPTTNTTKKAWIHIDRKY